jgi:23S rRNA pseudouridine1911/1915/1917 synthase
VDIARLPGGQGRAEVESLPILYEDEDLIAVNKPSGLPTVPTADPGRPSVFSLLKDQLRARDGGADVAYLGVHQRLDVETSGVVVFAKRQDANEWLAHAFATRTVVKVYVALTVRPPSLPPETWRVDRPVETAHGEAGRSRGAVTELSLTRVLRRALLVEARPETGRRHQVRIHLAASGLPILGDTKYGGPAHIGRMAVPRVMLHAARLTVPRGATDSRLELSAPLPPDFENLVGILEAS